LKDLRNLAFNYLLTWIFRYGTRFGQPSTSDFFVQETQKRMARAIRFQPQPGAQPVHFTRIFKQFPMFEK